MPQLDTEMDPTSSQSCLASGPLQSITPERVNQQREPLVFLSSVHGELRESSVHEKISQFNNLAMQSKQLERKTADAALKRAMLGREEAESEMRRYRDETRALHKQIEEGRERERRVGERLETVMENYGRAKETHAHTQALWEKEIRRARKETFKTQSTIVKLQEELKAARSNLKVTEEGLERERERSRAREQEAFAARYQIVGVQEQLEEVMGRIKVIEQERDAYKTLAKNEEVARIAAEGRIPLPQEDNKDDEFASPKKVRVSLSTADIVSSAASKEEIEELTCQVMWERQRADRAQEMVEFLQTECHLRSCPCAKAQPRLRSSVASPRRRKRDTVEIADPSDLVILSEAAGVVIKEEVISPKVEEVQKIEKMKEEKVEEEPKPPRRSTIFCAKEGIFRTLSQQEAEAIENENGEGPESQPPTPADPNANPRMYARTPSVDPPAFALLNQERTSLLSLLNAPHQDNCPPLPKDFVIPVTPDMPEPSVSAADADPDPDETPLGEARPHTSNAFCTVTTTTTVPLRDENTRPATVLGGRLRTPSGSNATSFDTTNPALTPTMTREQALAQIRERRGRARSVAQGVATPRRKMVEGVERRDVSAPTVRGKVKS